MSRVLALAVFMTLVPVNAMADHSTSPDYLAERLADELADSLQRIAHEASDEADTAKRYGQHAEAKALSDLADTAASLEDKVYRSVIAPLNQGTPDNIVKAQLQRLQSSFSFLERDGREVSRYSYQLARDVQEVLALKSDLLRVLSADDRGRPGRPGRPGR